ncbi:unnamed protein product [Orchesella dallaii]|uniref:Gustatory receptor n=1 Tax=Orchesella dallaii TaxID=48710 RepID=A0ABP1PKZ0_9HEXA
MLLCIPENCILRKAHTVIDVELQKEQNNENGSEVDEPSELVPIELSSMSMSLGQKSKRRYLEIWLNFFYFLGVSPFRVDSERNLRSFCINKLVSILIKVLAIAYTVLDIRRLVWTLDWENLTQQHRASMCIGVVNQFCSILLHVCLLRMVWFKQTDFLRLFKFQDRSEDTQTNSTNIKSYFGTCLAILLCSITIFISLLCSVGGLPILSWLDTWSLSEILLHNEELFILSLKNINDFNESATTQSNFTGMFMSDGELETIIIGSSGITMNFCRLIDTFYSHDCLLLSAISLWMSTKPLRDQLSLWESRSRQDSDYEIEDRNMAEDLLKKHKQLNLLSKKINAITNCFLPVLSMTSMITMSYFMHTCVIRDWFVALYLALKLCKVCITIRLRFFAMRISFLAEACNNWFISEDVQSVLQLNAKDFQRQNAAMNQDPFGIGSGVFYIDTRYLLNALGLALTYYIMMVVG